MTLGHGLIGALEPTITRGAPKVGPSLTLLLGVLALGLAGCATTTAPGPPVYADLGSALAEIRLHDKAVLGALFSPDESHILTWSKNGTALLWDGATSAQIGPAHAA